VDTAIERLGDYDAGLAERLGDDIVERC